MAETRQELQRQYDTLTKRIEAVDTDIGRETDTDRKDTLRQRRGELLAERDRVMASLAAMGTVYNGDLEELRRKVDRLGRLLAREEPEEAHEVILECVDALAKIDARIGGLERRVTVIERRIDPPAVVRLWQTAAVLALVIGAVFFMLPANRDLLMTEHPFLGSLVAGGLVLLAAAFWRLGQLSGRPT